MFWNYARYPQLRASTQGAVLFSDDFESYSANSTLGTLGSGGSAAGPTGYRIVRDENTATPFGTPNQYAELADTGTSTSPGQYIRLQSSQYSAAAALLTTLSFDFYEPSDGGASAMQFGYAITSNDLNTTGSRLRLNLDDGVIGGLANVASNTYRLNTAYTIYVIFNDTTSAVSYDGGSIAAESAHVWFEELGSGSFIYAGSANATNSQSTAYTVGFRTFNGDLQEMWVDKVSLFEGAAAVPEPRAALLGGIGLLALLHRRRS